MKKLLISVICLLLLILTGMTIVNGLQIGGLSILGIQGIQKENEELDSKIQASSKLASTDYPKALSDMQQNLKRLQDEKKNYEDMVSVSTDSEVQTAKQFQKYPIEYLWIQIGKHAKSEGVIIKLVIAKGSNNTQETYNLNFTATGAYAQIAEFIRDIEDDSSLGFKIEEFKLVPNGTENDLQATFVCKNITIKDISQNSIATQNEVTQNNNSTTNTTNTNNTTNSNNIVQ